MKKSDSKFNDDAFAERRLFFYNPVLRKLCNLELYIPSTRALLDYAERSYVIADMASTAHANKDVDAPKEELKEEPEDGDRSGPPFAPSASKAKVPEPTFAERQAKSKAEARQLEVSADRQSLLQRYYQDVESNADGHLYQVHPTLAPLVLTSATRLADKERNREIFNELKSKGSFRPLASIPADRFDAVFDELRQSHPLFADVIEYVRTSLRLALRRGVPQCVAPMLLVGPPGLGKTHFAKAFATALGAEYHLMSFDSDHKATALMGQDKNWGNNTPGLVFDALVRGECANAVVVLDEVDKSRAGFGQYQHPLASLHSLLEPVSSKSVKDISTEIEIDASLITWVCTANTIEGIPATIVSRLKVFHIQPPMDAALAIQMARVMLSSMHELMALDCISPPSPSLASLIAHLSPREQRQELERAYALAVDAGRSFICATDFKHLDESADKSIPSQTLH